jgi:hypothetical protein
MRILILTSCLSIVLCAACSKSSDEQHVKTRTEILASGKWTLSTANAKVTSGSNVQEYDLMTTLLKDCEKDNILIFHSNLTSEFDEGAAKCDSTKPQTTPGTWTFLNGETKLKGLNGLNGNVIITEIIELNNSFMTLKYDTTYLTLPTVITTTWTHIQ